jgi:pyridoxal 5'-phosphate synthase pdxT subunit
VRIGILALQGAVEAHAQILAKFGVEPVRVKWEKDLAELTGIILPGGESTTMIHLMKLNGLWEPLRRFVQQRPAWGVCAGAILLAKRVHHPVQESLEALDAEVERNAFGRQNESFVDQLTPTPNWIDTLPVEAVFIRAPRFRGLFGKAKPLLTWKEEPVLIEDGAILASSFHPELTDSTKVHEYFLTKVRSTPHRG